MKIKSIFSRTIQCLLIPTMLCFTLSGCSKSTSITTTETSDKKDETNPVTIKYVGNSCFYITFSDGTKLVTDPYGSSFAAQFGKFPEMEADVITISHNHSDHIAGIDSITGDPKIIQPEDLNKTIKIGGVEITGYSSKHVRNMCDNAIFVYKYDGLKIVHMGETDNIESKEAQEAVKDADVLLCYAGEYGDVKNKDSFETLNKMNVKVMIPQHYSTNTKNIFYGEPTIDKIIAAVPPEIRVIVRTELIVKKDLEKRFIVLTPMIR